MSAKSLHAQQLPNFVIIYADDMGYADISPYGAKTPNPESRPHGEGRDPVHRLLCSAAGLFRVAGGVADRLLPQSHRHSRRAKSLFQGRDSFERTDDCRGAQDPRLCDSDLR